ncbi:uncharacterized protein V2V93DRAFT_364086 [Kockiozyma suomiensis]|uniref:uncharacterized protein n=1 Tax=Kockiozyma suomiensis TaxID=1337062 RepID=UPI003342FB31
MADDSVIPVERPTEDTNFSTADVASENDGENTTLFVRSIPFSATSESLSDFFSQICPVKHSVIVTDHKTKESKGFGFVTFALASDASKAMAECRKTKFEGRVLNVDLAKKRERKEAPKQRAIYDDEGSDDEDQVDEPRTDSNGELIERRRPRLIIRNMPWSIRDPDELKKLFMPYGKVTECIIPRKAGGRMSGFAFVTMRKRVSAENAIKAVNGKEMNGRPIAVDYAVQKDVWTQHQKSEIKTESAEEDSSDDSDAESENEALKEESDDDISVKSEDNSETEIKEESGSDQDIKMEDESSGNEEEEENDSDSDEEEEDDEAEDDEEEEQTKSFVHRSEVDTKTPTTVFIRNLSYATTAESLKSHFESNFGPVRYALPVIDKETEMPRGTGFVCFYNAGDHASCIAAAPKQVADNSVLIADDVDQRYVLDSRILSVTSAVDRERAGKLQSAGAQRRLTASGKDNSGARDKRHVFLLNEGRIAPDSELGQAMSKTDMDIRQQSLAARRQQLRSNPSLHLSLTRLAVRNIPRSMTEAQLKALARKAVVGFAEDVKAGVRLPLSKEELERSRANEEQRGLIGKKKKFGVVKQVKIITEDKKTGAGRSRGYGFVEFSTHRCALMGLRWLNAREISPKYLASLQADLDRIATTKADAAKSDDVDGEGSPLSAQQGKKGRKPVIKDAEDLRKRRIVVEFAIENIEVVKRREAREFKARSKGEKKDNGNEEENIDEEKEEEKIVIFSKTRANRGGLNNKRGSSRGKGRPQGLATGTSAGGKRKRDGDEEGAKHFTKRQNPGRGGRNTGRGGRNTERGKIRRGGN